VSEPRVIPMLAYADAGAAAEWICRAFGFRETERFADRTGTVTDVVLQRPDGATVLVGHPNDAYEGPRRHAEHCAAAAHWLDRPVIVDGLVVYVDDIEAHYAAAARTVGARTGAITLLVSHRFSTVRMADLIAVLDGGELIEFGTHGELMQRNGHYAELFKLQARAYA